MANVDFSALVARHRKYFLSGATRPLDWRDGQLAALQAMLSEHADEFYDALWMDLRRNRVEADLADVRFVSNDAAHARAHLRKWMRPQVVPSPIILAPARTRVRFDPLGVGLIIGTWNYPLMLTLSPLVAAISGGNAAVIKTSEVAPATADLLARVVPAYMDNEAFSVVQGSQSETTALLEQQWDHIFFTGGPAVGRVVMTAAAKNLTPVVLELGGKNPTVVHSSADLKVAARRIASGRWMNAGQTCTAPDYILVFKDVARRFLQNLKESVLSFYGEDPQKSPDFGRIVSDHHFDRLKGLLASGEVYHGGRTDRSDRFIEPTILVNLDSGSPVMQEEVFGPILPVLEVESIAEAIAFINARPNPLSIYVFSEDRAVAEQMLDATCSGDAVVNDCAVHPLVHELPFGGVGNSGMGKYHGEWGFRAYTNPRGVVYHSTALDVGVRYPPYSERKIARKIVARLSS
jgi:aldehyde dehydrogenase (NAD+)